MAIPIGKAVGTVSSTDATANEARSSFTTFVMAGNDQNPDIGKVPQQTP